MPRTIDIVIGDTTHQIEQLRTRQANGWRKTAWGVLLPLIESITCLLDWRSVDLDDAAAMKRLIDQLAPAVLDSIDVVTECVIAYAPTLKQPIEDEAYDDDVVKAFAAILKAALPFGELVRAMTGSPAPRTGASSPSASGDDGTTS